VTDIEKKPLRRVVPISSSIVRELTGGHSLSSLYELARADPPRLAGVMRIGRRVLVDLDKLEAWLDAGGSRSQVKP